MSNQKLARFHMLSYITPYMHKTKPSVYLILIILQADEITHMRMHNLNTQMYSYSVCIHLKFFETKTPTLNSLQAFNEVPCRFVATEHELDIVCHKKIKKSCVIWRRLVFPILFSLRNSAVYNKSGRILNILRNTSRRQVNNLRNGYSQ